MATRQTKAEAELQALREADADADPSNDPTPEDLAAAEAAVVARGRRPEDVLPDLTAERDQARVEATRVNMDGEWLAPVDARGRLLVDLPVRTPEQVAAEGEPQNATTPTQPVGDQPA